MYKPLIFIVGFLILSSNLIAQKHFEDVFPTSKMEKDLALFIDIRKQANSGLFKYRSKTAIDSLHQQAFKKLSTIQTYQAFYNLICEITAFEGSCHNATGMNKKIFEQIKLETSGYFPFPIKMFGRTVRINFNDGDIPLGAEIISINGNPMKTIIERISKYANTDGNNSNGKNAFFNASFSKYLRYAFGKKAAFLVEYKEVNRDEIQSVTLQSVGYAQYYRNYDNRYFGKLEENDDDSLKYAFELRDDNIGILHLHSFGIDDTKRYQSFLDSCLNKLATHQVEHLIIDIRRNTGGSAPHDMMTLRCFTSQPHKEIQSAWVSMTKIPYWEHFKMDIPFFIRPIARMKINKELKKSLPIEKNNRRYYRDIKAYTPHANAYKGKIYLLIGPSVASAASLFAAMMISHTNTISIGEETMGAYYGHNGVFPIAYELPKSKIKTVFSVVNLEQDVTEKASQFRSRGIIPDKEIQQSIQDFLDKRDTQMEYIIESLINFQ